MYKTKIVVEAACPKHPHYNPERGGRASIRGACATCEEVYETFARALVLSRSFGAKIEARIKQELSPEERERRRKHALDIHAKRKAAKA